LISSSFFSSSSGAQAYGELSVWNVSLYDGVALQYMPSATPGQSLAATFKNKLIVVLNNEYLKVSSFITNKQTKN
jgi:hypothetical protein